MGTCNQVDVYCINMRIAIWILVVILAVALVEGQKGKGKGKGKPSKGKGKPTKPSKPGNEKPSGGAGGKGKGKGNEEPTGTGANEEVGGKGGKGKGKGKGNGNLENTCEEGQKPCLCEELERAKKPKGKGKPSKPSKGKGKGKPSNSEKPEEPEEPENLEKPEMCCCEEGEGPGGEGPGGNKPEPRGFCIDDEKMVAICMAGSAVVEKAIPAWESCADQCEGYMRSSVGVLDMRAKKPKGKGKPSKPSKGKGKGKKPSKGKGSCPTVIEIMEKTKEKFACEICHFTGMGWIDDAMVANETIIEDDIMTLPSEISEALMGEDYDECMAKFEEKERAKEKCSYTEEEETQLEEVFRGVAHTTCFKKVFEIGCGTFMENYINDMISESYSGYGSGSGSEVDVVITG